MPPSCALLGGFAIGARVALLRQHYWNAWQSAAVIRQAHHTQCHALRMPAKTSLAGDKIDAPAACAVPFRSYCGGVVTRMRNVSEYMLVLPLRLVPFADKKCRWQVKLWSFINTCQSWASYNWVSCIKCHKPMDLVYYSNCTKRLCITDTDKICFFL